MARRIRAIGIALLIAFSPAQAQKKLLSNAWYDLQHAALDVGFVWTSPARINTRDLTALGLVAGATGLTLLVDDNLQEWIAAHPESAPVKVFEPFREDHRAEELGDIWFFIRGSSALWLIGLAAGSETLREAAMGCVASGVAQTFPRRGLYRVVARTRPEFTDDPYEFDVPGSKTWAKRSFFGGHGANAITCIAFWNHRFDLGLLEPVLYGAAVGVGLARVIDQAHWTSDSVLGLVWGYAIGRAVGLRMKARARDRPGAGEQEPGFFLDYRSDRVYAGWQTRF